MSKLDRLSKSSNPMLGEEVYKNALDAELVGTDYKPMTIQGAINKTFILLGLMLAGALVGFVFPNQLFFWGGIFGGAALFFLASSKKEKSATFAPIYAVVEGLFVGTASAMYSYLFDGIIFHAVTITLAILFMMLMIYKMGIIKVSDKFRAGVTMAVGAVMILYLVNIVLYFFGINMPFLHDGGPMAIGLSLLIIGIASLNLLLDFDNFEKGEQFRAPEYMEWYSAMGLLFTLIWLYIEIMRLLAMLMSSD